MKYIVLLLFTSALLVFVLYNYFMKSGEFHCSQFLSYNEAYRSGMISRGWIPDFIPTSATRIWEKHNIDTSSCRGGFNFATLEPVPFTNELCSMPVKNDSIFVVKKMNKDDSRKMTAQQIQSAGFMFYRYKQYVCAINFEKGEALYWVDLGWTENVGIGVRLNDKKMEKK